METSGRTSFRLARLAESAGPSYLRGPKSLLLSQLLRFLVYEVGTVIPASKVVLGLAWWLSSKGIHLPSAGT